MWKNQDLGKWRCKHWFYWEAFVELPLHRVYQLQVWLYVGKSDYKHLYKLCMNIYTLFIVRGNECLMGRCLGYIQYEYMYRFYDLSSRGFLNFGNEELSMTHGVYRICSLWPVLCVPSTKAMERRFGLSIGILFVCLSFCEWKKGIKCISVWRKWANPCTDARFSLKCTFCMDSM